MTYQTKLRPIGNSQGVTLPKALLEECQLVEGDELTTWLKKNHAVRKS